MSTYTGKSRYIFTSGHPGVRRDPSAQEKTLSVVPVSWVLYCVSGLFAGPPVTVPVTEKVAPWLGQ